MTCFCTLQITSDLHAELPAGLLKSPEQLGLQFDDHESAEHHAQAARMAALGLSRRKFPRYRWTFNSERAEIAVGDAEAHVKWVFAQLRGDTRLGDLRTRGFDTWLQLYWEGAGRGGGPTISAVTSGLLAQHAVELRLGFYAVDD